jgi:hypothetical protein
VGVEEAMLQYEADIVVGSIVRKREDRKMKCIISD